MVYIYIVIYPFVFSGGKDGEISFMDDRDERSTGLRFESFIV